MPDSFEKAALGWLFRARRPLVYVTLGLCFVFFALTWLWEKLPENVKARVGEVILGRSSSPSLPDARKNDATLFQVLERRDRIDLDQIREVPRSLLDRDSFVSPSVRSTALRLVRKSSAMMFFFNHSTTSGPSNEIVCLSGQEFDVRRIRDLAKVGEQRLNSYELAIHVGDLPLDTPSTIAWQTIGWNKFQGLDNQWVSVRVEYPCARVQLAVDFPAESGLTSRDVQLIERRTDDRDSWRPFRGTVQLADGAGNLVEWTISEPDVNKEYAMRWSRLAYGSAPAAATDSGINR